MFFHADTHQIFFHLEAVHYSVLGCCSTFYVLFLLPSGSSTGSLSSFVVVSSPEDQVLSQLQLLVDQCRHGKSYCKQVLSLYELSKVQYNYLLHIQKFI